MLNAGLMTFVPSCTVWPTDDTSGNTRISTLPSGVIFGVTCRMTPTLRRSMFVRGQARRA